MSSGNQIRYTPSNAASFNLYMLEWQNRAWGRWMQESGRWGYLGPLDEEAAVVLLRHYGLQHETDLYSTDLLVTMGPMELRRLAVRQPAPTT